MRFRSSGLGEQELKANLADLSAMGEDLLVMHIETYDPVEWHLRAGVEFSDIPAIIKGLLKPSVFFLILRSLFYLKKNPREPENIFDKSI